MERTRAEFLVEPFTEGRPGPHVTAAVDALHEAGLIVEMGPFASTAEGDIETLADGVRDLLVAAWRAGATRVALQVGGGAELRGEDLHGALDRLVAEVEHELGAPLTELDRGDKQRAVRLLAERGAFLLRRSVEDVAAAMGVSRITIYNYLNAIT